MAITSDVLTTVSSSRQSRTQTLKTILNHQFLLSLILCRVQLRRTFFWWREVRSVFSLLLEQADYSLDLRSRYLAFFSTYLIPLMGPSPHEFNKAMQPCSYMADDFTPIEFSWVLDNKGGDMIRFTMEPLSHVNGSPTPSNSWLPCLKSLARVGRIQDFDTAWCQICFDTLVHSQIANNKSQHRSQFSVGADFTRTGIVAKAYFLPHLRSQATGLTMTEVVTNCMVQLDLQKQWAKVTAYAESLPTHLTATPEIVSVDCIEASRNRVKIYFRTPASSLNDLVALFTLGGQLSDPAIVKTVTTLRHLWKLLFASVGDDEPVLSKSPNHYASGFVVYFELGVGRETPAPKIYLPVRHYCANDEEVGRAMSQYYRDVGDEAMGERYINGIKSIFSHRPHSARTGVHAYIGCAARKKGPQVSVYLSPEAFAPERL